jgi:hypothetical protein
MSYAGLGQQALYQENSFESQGTILSHARMWNANQLFDS